MPRLPLQRLELALHLLAQLQVERAQRLVEQQHLRLVDQRARQRHALALAARQLRRPPVADARQLAPAPAVRRRGVRARPWPPCAPSARRPRCRGCSCAGTARSPGTPCSPAAHRAAACDMSSPPIRMRPAVGSVKPPIMRRQVVLPEPEGPSSVKNSPASIVRSTPSTARTCRSAERGHVDRTQRHRRRGRADAADRRYRGVPRRRGQPLGVGVSGRPARRCSRTPTCGTARTGRSGWRTWWSASSRRRSWSKSS